MRFVLWRDTGKEPCACGGIVVSVVIPVHNRVAFFEAAIESVLRQTHRSLEILVYDNGSTDGTWELAKELAKRDRRISVQRSETNIGMVGNFSAALQGPTSQYALMLMSDDLLRPDAVERMVQVLDANDDVQIVAARRVKISSRTALTTPRIDVAIQQRFRGHIKGENVAQAILRQTTNLIGEPSCVMFRLPSEPAERAEILSYGGSCEYHYNIDVSMWLNLLAKGNAYFVPEALAAVREHPGREQRSPSAAVAGAREWFFLIEAARSAGILDERGHGEAIYSARESALAILDWLKSTNNTSLQTEQQLRDLINRPFS